jgi:hypothetical protein
VLGYSFGARIVTGAIHLMAGGQLAGRVLPPRVGAGVAPRVVMVAAALHSTWLQPTGYHALAPTRLDHLLNLYNSRDPVLKRYRALDKCARPAAAGFAGLAAGGCGRGDEWLEQRDVSRLVGRTHAADHYLHHPHLLHQMRAVLLWK